MAAQFIEAKNIHLTFTPPNRMPVTVLKGFDVAVGEGDFVSIVGPSGCGKSTFQVDVVFAGLIMFMAISLILTGIVLAIEDRFSRWRPQLTKNY